MKFEVDGQYYVPYLLDKSTLCGDWPLRPLREMNIIIAGITLVTFARGHLDTVTWT